MVRLQIFRSNLLILLERYKFECLRGVWYYSISSGNTLCDMNWNFPRSRGILLEAFKVLIVLLENDKQISQVNKWGCTQSFSFYASGGTGIESVVRSSVRRRIYGRMIVCRLAELRGKSYAEKGMQFQDIPL